MEKINQTNQQFITEVVRNIAEYVIYSEQNLKGAYFDQFIEHNMMEHCARPLYLDK